MQKKLIVSDVDGTLFQTDHTISPLTKEAIQMSMAQGHHFAIATGRMHGAGKLVTQDLPYDGYLISCNGAVVKHVKTGEVIHTAPLTQESIIEAVKICRAEGIYFHLYDSETIYVFELAHLAKRYHDLMPKLPDALKFEIKVIDSVEAVLKSPIFKIGLFSEDLEKFERVKNALASLDFFEMCQSMTTSFDVNAKGVNKATGIQALGKHLGIAQSDVIAFGDNDNDMEMIQYAGVGVAMGNALETLKNVADQVTDTNDRDGIAKALKVLLEY